MASNHQLPSQPETVLAETSAPDGAPSDHLDVRSLGPPNPLKQTLERLATIDDNTVLVQFNDRAPQHLYPKLNDRGYEYETVDLEDTTVTVIWR